MKKIFSLFAAALMSVSLFAGWPATVPTIQDLSNAGYNITSARVIALYFEEEVCNDIVWYGSYNEWATDPTSMLKFETLEGFDGWYVVELNDESETVQGKPVQLKKDGSFSLDFQSGDADAWENMFQPYTKSATITNGESGEANCTWPNLSAYIYMVHYFKNHNTPCFPTYNYTINAYLPEFCEAIDDYNSADSVRVMGGFDNWTNGVQMIKTFDEDFNIYYTATINDVEEGTEFKLRFGSNWDVQVQKDGKDLANETTGTNETITLRYDGEGYGFAACAGPAEGDTPTSYLAPIYNTANNPTSGIKQWDTLTCDDYKVLTAASEQITLGTAGSTTWYVVNGADVQLTNGAVCNGDVRLILADDAKLTATGADSKAGIQVSGEGNSLTIYGQTAQSGQLIATGGEWGAGIGGEDGNYDQSVANGSNITINGGMIEAIGGFKGAGIGAGYRGNGSYITINRGTVVATGGDYGAGIGGGYGYHDSSVGNGSDIIINGGMVTANGGEQAAGIGGGYDGNGSNITINGGTVVANGRAWGAGIGGGHDGDGSNITINGGTVTANGDDGGAGIGGGNDGDGSNITINGGTVIAIGGYKGAGIGAGMDAFGFDIFVATSMLVKAGENENPTEVITNTGADLASSLAGKQYVTIEKTPITFIVPVIDQVNKQAVMLSHYPNGESEYVDYIDYRWYRNGELVAEGDDNFREPSALNGCYHIEVPVDATKSQWVPSNELCFQNGVFVGIDAIDEYNFSFSVVPNPVTKGSMMTVSTQLSEQQLQGASLMVYDLKGHIFTTMPMNQQSVTLTAEQTSGIYVIQITTRTGEKYIQKVVVR